MADRKADTDRLTDKTWQAGRGQAPSLCSLSNTRPFPISLPHPSTPTILPPAIAHVLSLFRWARACASPTSAPSTWICRPGFSGGMWPVCLDPPRACLPLSVCLPACLPVSACLSACLCLPVCLPACLSACHCLSACISHGPPNPNYCALLPTLNLLFGRFSLHLNLRRHKLSPRPLY